MKAGSTSGGTKPLDPRAAVTDETVRGTLPTVTVGETYAPEPVSLVADLAQLFKLRVTGMVVLTSCAGVFLAARNTGTLPPLIFLKIVIGIALVSGASSVLNQVMERESDGRMSRTRNRPLPAGRMSPKTGLSIGVSALIAGTAFLAFTTNLLSGTLALLTALAYVFIYTPLKKKTPLSTLAGAFPGAMPPLIGWTAVTGELGWKPLVLFAIMFFWQFPHFLAIAWLYREDYERAQIRMRPVTDPTGHSTIAEILFAGLMLIPVSVLPFWLGLGGKAYLVSAVVLGVGYLIFGFRLAALRMPPSAAYTKKYARQLLQASVIYLPLLFIVMMASRAGAR
jgi:protoheme IX farnesyltransferase